MTINELIDVECENLKAVCLGIANSDERPKELNDPGINLASRLILSRVLKKYDGGVIKQ